MMIPTARVRTGKTGLTAWCFGTRHAVARAATQRRRATCHPTRCVSSLFLPFPKIHAGCRGLSCTVDWGAWGAIDCKSDILPLPLQGTITSEYKCCPDGDSKETEETCDRNVENVTWTPGVCYWVHNRRLHGAAYSAFSEPLFQCEVHSARVNGLLIGMVLLATARILLQLVWYRRCNAKLDFGKKGFNLWLIAIPVVATGLIVQYYWRECVHHMGIYSLIRDELAGNFSFISNPENFRALADKQPPPRAGTVSYCFYMLTELCCAPLWISNLD